MSQGLIATIESGIDAVARLAGKVGAMLAPDALLPAIGYSAAFALAALVIEFAAVGWRRSALRKVIVRPSRSTITDFVTYVLGAIQVLWLIGSVMTAGLLFLLTKTVGPIVAFDLGSHVPPLLHWFLLLVVFDLCEYWFHRASHESEALWQLHQFHHAAEEMTVFTVLRVHPVEVAIRLVIYTLVGALLGASPYEILPVVYGRAVLAALKHSDVEWRWGAFGNWVLQSPHLHRVHHAMATDYHHCNYAILFTAWDRLFGTHVDSDDRIARIGVHDTPLNGRHFVADMWICYVGFMKALARGVARPFLRRRDVPAEHS